MVYSEGVITSTGGITTTAGYLQDATSPLAVVLRESSSSSGVSNTNSYLYQLGSSSPLFQSYGVNNTNRVWYHSDGLGSVRALTNGSGQVQDTTSYSAFGGRVGESGKSSSSYGFAGEQLDPTGLYFNRARYYNPNLGRFISRDSTMGSLQDPTSLNRFIYTGNNPTLYTDPSGYGPMDNQFEQGGMVGSDEYSTTVVSTKSKSKTQLSLDPGATLKVAASKADDQDHVYIHPNSTPNGFDDVLTFLEGSYQYYIVNGGDFGKTLEHYNNAGTQQVAVIRHALGTGPEGAARYVAGLTKWLPGWGGITYAGEAVFGQNVETGAALDLGGRAESLTFALFSAADFNGSSGVKLSGKASAEAGGEFKFYSVQNANDLERLKNGGTPWPEGANKAFVGQGFYAWGDKGIAEAYANHLIKNRGATDLSIVEAGISRANYNNLKTLDLRLNDDLANEFFAARNLGLPHPYQHVIRGAGSFGDEYFFSKDIFDLLKLK